MRLRPPVSVPATRLAAFPPVAAIDPSLFQSPFRAGIKIDAYQMEPLREAEIRELLDINRRQLALLEKVEPASAGRAEPRP